MLYLTIVKCSGVQGTVVTMYMCIPMPVCVAQPLLMPGPGIGALHMISQFSSQLTC